jgi:hypothetical protein
MTFLVTLVMSNSVHLENRSHRMPGWTGLPNGKLIGCAVAYAAFLYFHNACLQLESSAGKRLMPILPTDF